VSRWQVIPAGRISYSWGPPQKGGSSSAGIAAIDLKGARTTDAKQGHAEAPARCAGSQGRLTAPTRRRWPTDQLLASGYRAPQPAHRYARTVPEPWWRELSGVPPSVRKSRERDLRPWEVWLFRAYLPLFPLLVIAAASAVRNPGVLVLCSLPFLQLVVMPAHQRKQVLGR
jgi:hypothetical protein